jgi:hypothetical protein
MRTRLTVAVASLAGLLLGAVPVVAHHSFAAEYDANKPIKLTGTVTKIEWTNPHCYFYIDVKTESGKVESWALELGNPNALLRNGWTPKSVKIGDEVAVEGTRAKDGTLLGNARSMVLSTTGQRLFAGSSQTTPNP